MYHLHSLFDEAVLFSEAGSLLLSSNLRAAALLILCFFLVRAIGRSATFRHLLIVAVLGGILLLPVLGFLIPAVEVVVEVALTDLSEAAENASEPLVGHSGAVAAVQTQWTLTDLAAGLALLYVLGLAINLARQMWAILVIALLSWAARPVADLSWQRACRQARTNLRVRRKVQLRCSTLVSSPQTWGIFRPLILLPPAARHWPPHLIRSAMLHEMAHIRRCDWLSQQIARLACAFYWINPLCWKALRQLEDNAESACDDLVLQTGVDRTDYASDLMNVARQVCGRNALSTAALAMSAGCQPSQLAQRIRSILNGSCERQCHRWLATITLASMLFVVFPLASLRASYIEVPVFEARTLTPIRSLPSEAQASTMEQHSGPAAQEFDREAFKQAAVTELRTTMAKMNAATREWLGNSTQNRALPEDGEPASVAEQPGSEDQLATAQSAISKQSEEEKAKPPVGEKHLQASSTPEIPQARRSQEHPLFLLLLSAINESRNARHQALQVIKPSYPRRALERGIEGEVVVAFDIDSRGQVKDAHIVQASPAGVFDQHVLRALQGFRYRPAFVDGRPSEVEGVREVFRFELRS